MMEIMQTLQAANARLKQTTGTTALFEVFYHVNPFPIADTLTVSELLTWTGHSLETPVEQLDFSNFPVLFNQLSRTTSAGESFTTLQITLETKLTNLRIYRINADLAEELYCIGQDAEGNFVGLKQAFALK